MFLMYTVQSERNKEKISSAHAEVETRKATICLLRTLILLTQTLDALPDNVMMTMKLLYYDDGIIVFLYSFNDAYEGHLLSS